MDTNGNREWTRMAAEEHTNRRWTQIKTGRERPVERCLACKAEGAATLERCLACEAERGVATHGAQGERP